MTAIVSDCDKYRYLLTRPAEVESPLRSSAVFVMLNPSTADATLDDPTIRRCRGFAKAWGCNGLVVANLFAYRATNPKELKLADDPIGPDNDKILRELAKEHYDIVCAWGSSFVPAKRVIEVLDILSGAR